MGMGPETVIENPDLGICLSDGTRLSARVWMPASCGNEHAGRFDAHTCLRQFVGQFGIGGKFAGGVVGDSEAGGRLAPCGGGENERWDCRGAHG